MVITLDSESSDPGSSPGRTLFFLAPLFSQVATFAARRVKLFCLPQVTRIVLNSSRETFVLSPLVLDKKILHGDIPLFLMSTTAAPRGTAIRGPRRALEVAVNWTSNAYGTEITLII